MWSQAVIKLDFRNIFVSANLMKRFRTSHSASKTVRKNSEEPDSDPEIVWDLLGDVNINDQQSKKQKSYRAEKSIDLEEARKLKQKRLERAKKFKGFQASKKLIKMSDEENISLVVVRRNQFRVTDKQANYQPPLPLSPETGPPPLPQERGLPPLPQETESPPPPAPSSQSAEYTSDSTTVMSDRSYSKSSSEVLILKEVSRSEDDLRGTGKGYQEEVLYRREEVSKSEGSFQGPSLNRLQRCRGWVHNSSSKGNVETEDPSLGFRLMSYNVLAQNLLETNMQLYRNVDPYYLSWETRWAGIQAEVVDFNPDVVCLQEVQFRRPNYFRRFYLPFFEELGYRAVFKSRTGDKQDGCVIFYKISMFKLEEYSLVEYLRPGISILNRDNVGIVCRLVPRVRGLPALVVGTTHLLFNKKRSDVRLAQIGVFLAEVDRLSWINGRNCPTVITGDFNSSTDSEIYQLLMQGSVDHVGLPVPAKLGLTDTCQWEKHLRDTEQREMVVFGSGSISQRLGFRSIHQQWEQRHDPDRVVSTNHGDWTNVDFVMYSQGGRAAGTLDLVSRYVLPRWSDMKTIGRIPSDVCPSDHFPLLADFLLKP